MARRANYFRRLTLALALMLPLTPAARAQESTAQPSPRGGITVHGHWTIDVVNADGAVASHTEFENALLTSASPTFFGGNRLLAAVLADRASMFDPNAWSVVLALQGGQLTGPSPQQPSEPSGGPACGTAAPCVVAEGTSGAHLIVSAPTLGQGSVPAGTVRLDGSTTATAAGSIGWVESRYATAFLTTHIYRFTGRSLPSPVAVAEGQIIQFSVEFSFS